MSLPTEVILLIVGHYHKRVAAIPLYRRENVVIWCDKCNAKHYDTVKVECGVKMQTITGDLASAKALRMVSTDFAAAYGIAYIIENIGCDFGRGEYMRLMRTNWHFALGSCFEELRINVDIPSQSSIIGTKHGRISARRLGRRVNTFCRPALAYERDHEIGTGKTFSTSYAGFLSRLNMIGLTCNVLKNADKPYESPGPETKCGITSQISIRDYALGGHLTPYALDAHHRSAGAVGISVASIRNSRTNNGMTFERSEIISTFPPFGSMNTAPERTVRTESHEQLAPPVNQRLAPVGIKPSKKYPRIRSKQLNKQSNRRR